MNAPFQREAAVKNGAEGQPWKICFSFAASARESAPLADRMRPRTLDEFVGQAHIVGPGRLLRRAIEAGRLTSSIFWGPPGTGKTTLASIIAGGAGAEFARLNAVTSGVSDVRAVIADAQERLKLYGRPTYLLLDECHRWSKAQSDSILPAIERSTIRFIGSTTENPSIAMTPAIVSRCRLFQFYPLSDGDIRAAVLRAIADAQRGYGAQDVRVDEDALDHIVRMAGGDARSALNALELAVLTTPLEADGSTHVTLEVAQESIQSRATKMDESMLYDMLSAFCKSMRGSDSDAALAWFARMVQAGVDPRIVVRHVIVHASEDVGLANPMAMLQAEAASRWSRSACPRRACPSRRRSSPCARARSRIPWSPPCCARSRMRRKTASEACPSTCATRTTGARRSSVPARATAIRTTIPGIGSRRSTRRPRRAGFPITFPANWGLSARDPPAPRRAGRARSRIRALSGGFVREIRNSLTHMRGFAHICPL